MKRTQLVISFVAAAVSLLLASTGFAHQFWVNAHQVNMPPHGHAMISLSFGHKPPLDEYLANERGFMELKSYELYNPDNTAVPIVYKKQEKVEPQSLPGAAGAKIMESQLFDRMLTFSPDMKKGTWQVAAEQEWDIATGYLDENNKFQYAKKGFNEIKGAKEILFSMAAKFSGKAFFTVGDKWTQPKPVGHLLEIVPTSDLSNLKAGDTITFQLLYKGKPMKKFYHGDIPVWPHFSAYSSNFGGETEGFHLAGYFNNGDGRLRIPEAGQWILYSDIYLPIDKKEDPELYGKAKYRFISGSMSFHVK